MTTRLGAKLSWSPPFLSVFVAILTLGSSLLLTVSCSAQLDQASAGSLVLVGGGSLEGTGILEKFVDLAGGPSANIILIPTASGQESYGDLWRGKEPFERLGVENLTVLHTSDRDEANSEEFASKIRKADGVWIGGGRQWRLADSYLNTEVHKELFDLLSRGGVIGGTSAGATIQGSYLARGDTKTNTVMMGDHEKGFAFINNVAVDQHLLKANRQFDLIEIVKARPELLGIGLDEGTAIVVSNNQFEVMGDSYVAIYDHSLSIDSGGHFYFLSEGDRFDLDTRKARRGDRGIGRVVERDWN